MLISHWYAFNSSQDPRSVSQGKKKTQQPCLLQVCTPAACRPSAQPCVLVTSGCLTEYLYFLSSNVSLYQLQGKLVLQIRKYLKKKKISELCHALISHNTPGL
jgi:hypothetical protein